MKKAVKRLLSLLFSLCLGWSILSFIPLTASADDVVIEKVLATAQPGPVVLMDIGNVVVATSTEGCTVGSVTWTTQDGLPASGSFQQQQTYRLEIRIDAGEGYSFSAELRAYLNNSGVDAAVDPAGKSVTLVREITPAVWAPTIIKHPGGETVDADGWASFVATAVYAESCSWILVSPDGATVVDCTEIGKTFPGSSVKDDGAGKIVIYNIPVEMNGWQIKAVFKGPGGSKTSNGAYIKVKDAPEEPEATPEPTPTPTPTPTPEPTPSPEVPAESAAPETHEHRFGESWVSDGSYHWHECQCGEQNDKAAHSFQWSVVRAATKKEPGEEKGVCTVCGYETTRALEYDADGEDILRGGYIGWVLAGIVLVVVILVVVDVVRSSRRSRRNRRRRRR
ncbi:MAG: hypothetical protein MSO56_05620 [Clostridiales bacterium]|nr:hypothetical protein [Clostridiales bacterium]